VSFNNPFISSYNGSFLLDEHFSREVNRDFPDTGGNRGTYGWSLGGSISGPSNVSTVDRLDFSNDLNSSSSRGALSSTRGGPTASNNSTYGWTAGGWQAPASPVMLSSVDRITYSNDTQGAAIRSPLSSAKRYLAASTNGQYGWFAGGDLNLLPTGEVTTVDRIDYANDSVNISVRGPLLVAKKKLTGFGNMVFGYVASGQGGSPVVTNYSTVERINYSNDIVASIARSLVNVTRTDSASVGNTNYGWIAGGNPNQLSSVDRIDYANDTTTASARGVMTAGKLSHSAEGNANYGWFIGGTPAPTPVTPLSSSDRIDYANDTATAVSRGTLSLARWEQGSAPNYVVAWPIYNSISSDIQKGYGWIAAGMAPMLSSVDRIDFSNDSVTTIARSPILTYRSMIAGTSNSNYGWIGGGYTNTPASATLSSTERIDFANDVVTPSGSRGPLAFARYRLSAAGNTNYGWWTGGYSSPTNVTSSVDRYDYSNDDFMATVRAVLPTTLWQHSSMYSGSFVYTASGSQNNGGTMTSAFYRIEASNDLASSLSRGGVAVSRYFGGATSNNNYGWFSGGYSPTAPASDRSTVERIDFSVDTNTASLRSPLSVARGTMIAGVGNSNYGWFAGGRSAPVGNYSYVDRIDYSNDLVTAGVRGPLSIARYYHAGVSNYVKERQQPLIGGNINGTHGWYAGGQTPLGGTTVYRIDFSVDNISAAIRGSLVAARYQMSTSSGNSNYGWHAGGNPGTVTTVSRITYANDNVVSTARGPLNVGRYQGYGIGNTDYGWHGSTGSTNIVERIDYANDSSVASTRGILTTSLRTMYATAGNDRYGWFSGGKAPATISTIDRIDYSNDAATALLRGSLSSARYFHAASSNRNYGWFSGGYIVGTGALSVVDRIDFSNDSSTILTRGPLTTARYGLAATGNSNYGWHVGSMTGSEVQRIDYASDSVAASSRGPLPYAQYRQGATSNYAQFPPNPVAAQYNKGTSKVGTGAGTYGWYATGIASAVIISSIERIIFSSDTALNTIRSNVSVARTKSAAVSTASYGWWGGGYQSSSNKYSYVDRLDFSNDSANASARGTLTTGRSYLAGLNNINYGWWAGADGVSIVDRITFQNDLVVASPRTFTLSALTGGRTGISLSAYGWSAGGNTSFTSIERLSFSNDLTQPLARGGLTNARYNICSVNSYSYGYFIGGFNGANTSFVDRLDLANDTTNTVAKTSYPLASNGIGATSSLYYAWGNGSTLSTSLNRIDYSNDSAYSTRGTMTAARYCGVGASDHIK